MGDTYWRPFYERLGSSFGLILFDKRGTGLSDRGGSFPTLETRMEDVNAVPGALGGPSVPIHDWLESLELERGVGPLAGKTILGTVGFFASWLVLGIAWRTKELDLRRWFWIALALGLVGAVLMFPPVFQAFTVE